MYICLPAGKQLVFVWHFCYLIRPSPILKVVANTFGITEEALTILILILGGLGLVVEVLCPIFLFLFLISLFNA